MDFALPDELVELQDTVRRLAREKVRPRARDIDRSGEYPQDLFEIFRDAGLLGLCIPESHGGSGAGILGLTVAIEEVAKYSNTAALMLLLTRLPTGPVMIAGSEEQKRRYLPGIADGSRRAAFGLSEPQAGSDVMGMRTRAVADGGDWVLSGTKCWMSGVREADWYTVFAKSAEPASRAHDSVTAFIVERATAGVSVGRTDHKMGVRGVDTGELLLDEVRVPAANVIGEVGGFRLAMLGLNSMRPVVAARGIGLAEGALMYATEYVKQRAAFGKTIADFQGIQWEIAKCAVDIEAARLLTYRAAWLADQGRFTKPDVPLLSMAKYHATELAVRASGLAVQLLGAAGYMEDHPTEQWYRDAKQLTIVEGTSQVQLGLIARGVLDGDLWWDSSAGMGAGLGAAMGAGEGLDPFDELGGWSGVLGRLVAGEDLRTDEAAAAMTRILEGGATMAQIAGFVVALRAKGESVEELTGMVRAMLDHAVPVHIEGDLVDTCGTGGDKSLSINVSTLSALIVAGAGAKVCKHGNRAATSAAGSADVLEALGVVIDLGPEGVARCVEEAGIGFCFAPRYHPAMRHAGPVRSELGIPTVFNVLGPLANPARVPYQVVGVSNPQMAGKMLGVLGANGTRRAMVVHGSDGLDELSTTGPSTVLELTPTGIKQHTVDATELGLSPATLADIRGGDAAFNAQVVLRVVDGERGPNRDISVLNAAAALTVVGLVADLADGVELATTTIDSGRARQALDKLVEVSGQARSAASG